MECRFALVTFDSVSLLLFYSEFELYYMMGEMSYSEFDQIPFPTQFLLSMKLDVVFNVENASSEHQNSVRMLMLQFLERLENSVHIINAIINSKPLVVNHGSANSEWLTHSCIRRIIHTMKFRRIDSYLGCIDKILDAYKTNDEYGVKSIVLIPASDSQILFDNKELDGIVDRVNSMRDRMHINVVVIASAWNNLHAFATRTNGLSLNYGNNLIEYDLQKMIKTMTRDPTLVCRSK